MPMKLPNGYGSVCKMSGKRRNPYRVRIAVGRNAKTGAVIQKTLGYYPTRKDALDALAEYNRDPYDLTAEKLTFAEVYARWRETDRYKKLSKSMQYQYSAAYSHSSPLYSLPMASLRLSNLQMAMDVSGVNYPSRERIKILWNALFEYAIRYEVVRENIVPRVDLGEKEEKEDIHKPFTPAEIDTLWEHLNVPWLDTVLILIYTGMRYGELLSMQTESVHPGERYMVGGSKTDAGKNRIIPLHRRILPLVEKYYKDALDSSRDTLLPAMSTNVYRNRFEKALVLSGVSPHLTHDCRHTFASRMDAAGANIRAIKAIMGHTGGDVTDKVYIHKAVDELLKNIDLLS